MWLTIFVSLRWSPTSRDRGDPSPIAAPNAAPKPFLTSVWYLAEYCIVKYVDRETTVTLSATSKLLRECVERLGPKLGSFRLLKYDANSPNVLACRDGDALVKIYIQHYDPESCLSEFLFILKKIRYPKARQAYTGIHPSVRLLKRLVGILKWWVTGSWRLALHLDWKKRSAPKTLAARDIFPGCVYDGSIRSIYTVKGEETWEKPIWIYSGFTWGDLTATTSKLTTSIWIPIWVSHDIFRKVIAFATHLDLCLPMPSRKSPVIMMLGRSWRRTCETALLYSSVQCVNIWGMRIPPPIVLCIAVEIHPNEYIAELYTRRCCSSYRVHASHGASLPPTTMSVSASLVPIVYLLTIS